jgi:iron transport multicopper oxidase
MESTTSPSLWIPFRYSVPGFHFDLNRTLLKSSPAGQRYSFILNANQPISNYWIRAQPTLPGSNQGFVDATNSAILRYNTAPIRDPTTSSTSTQPLVETALHPLINTPVPGAPHPGGADVVLNLDITLDLTDYRFKINNTVCDFL